LAYQHRVEGGRHLFFVINRSRTATKRCVLTLAGRGGVRAWDAVAGTTTVLPSFPAALDGAPARAVAVTLPPVGSALLEVAPDAATPARPRAGAGDRRLPLGPPVAIMPDEENVLVLDRCRFTVNGAGDGREHPVHAARSAAFAAACTGC